MLVGIGPALGPATPGPARCGSPAPRAFASLLARSGSRLARLRPGSPRLPSLGSAASRRAVSLWASVAWGGVGVWLPRPSFGPAVVVPFRRGRRWVCVPSLSPGGLCSVAGLVVRAAVGACPRLAAGRGRSPAAPRAPPARPATLACGQAPPFASAVSLRSAGSGPSGGVRVAGHGWRASRGPVGPQGLAVGAGFP